MTRFYIQNTPTGLRVSRMDDLGDVRTVNGLVISEGEAMSLDHEVDDVIAAFDNGRGLPTFTVPPEQTAVQIVGWMMSLMQAKNLDDAAKAQIQALADGILEGHWLNDAIRDSRPRSTTTSSSAVGPVDVDIDMAREFGWSEFQIARCIAVCHAASRLENRLVNHAKGYTRQCKVCECWTQPEGDCHLCEADKKADDDA